MSSTVTGPAICNLGRNCKYIGVTKHSRTPLTSPASVSATKSMEFVADTEAGDVSGVRECLVTPMYLQFLPRLHIAGPVTVLDIGAHVGGFALMLRANHVDIKRLAA